MSRKRKRGAKATAASMVMDTLKKRGAVDEKSAVDVSVFKNLPYATSTILYAFCISNLFKTTLSVNFFTKPFISKIFSINHSPN